MSNAKTVMEEWSVIDLEDNSSLSISVLECTELGNQSKPGIQVCYMGNIINFEPMAVERWAYQAGKVNASEYLLTDHSWTEHEDQYVKVFLLPGSPLKVKVEVKSRSSKPVSKEFFRSKLKYRLSSHAISHHNYAHTSCISISIFTPNSIISRYGAD